MISLYDSQLYALSILNSSSPSIKSLFKSSPGSQGISLTDTAVIMGLAARHRAWPKMQMPRSSLGSQCVKLEIVYVTMDHRRRSFYLRAVTYRFFGGRGVRSFRSWSRSRIPLHLDELTRTSLFLESVQPGRNSSSYAREKQSRRPAGIVPRFCPDVDGIHPSVCTSRSYSHARWIPISLHCVNASRLSQERCRNLGEGENL